MVHSISPATTSFTCNKCKHPTKKRKQPAQQALFEHCPTIEHNFDPKAFHWLFARYVNGMNEKYHCTNGFIGPYSDKIGAADRLKRQGKNQLESTIKFDEQSTDSYDAIYICGVAKKGYNTKEKKPYWEKENYKQNVHIAIKPVPGKTDQKTFNDKWNLKLTDGIFLPIPSEEELPERFKSLSDEFKKCRMYRWAACFYENLKKARAKTPEEMAKASHK